MHENWEKQYKIETLRKKNEGYWDIHIECFFPHTE